MRLFAVTAILLMLCACESTGPRPRTDEEAALFGPVSMRLHPIFTQVKNVSGTGTVPDGIEAVLEFDDQVGDPTKAAGTAIFELFEFRQGYPDIRGERLINPWPASLVSLDDQQAHWHREYGAYSFLLADPAIKTDRNYVLTATFEPLEGGRFFAQTILIGNTIKREKRTPTSEPTPEENGSGGSGVMEQ